MLALQELQQAEQYATQQTQLQQLVAQIDANLTSARVSHLSMAGITVPTKGRLQSQVSTSSRELQPA